MCQALWQADILVGRQTRSKKVSQPERSHQVPKPRAVFQSLGCCFACKVCKDLFEDATFGLKAE